VQEIYFNPSAHYYVLELLDPARARTWYGHRRQRSARLLGFVGMRVEGARGHISTLAVRSEWRGERLGEVLLLTSVDQAVRDGARVMGLEVRVSNTVAQALYAKYDFEARSRLHRYYVNGEDALYMRVQLSGGPGYRQRISTQLSALLAELAIERSATP
jgi:ribosomal protein S18 acetylase RimI-like enzyme